jgi:hypothetical protein
MTIQDQVTSAFTIWKENRGGGTAGMQSVLNAIMNRVAKNGTDAFTECLKPLQFSSMTAKGDPELTIWPTKSSPNDWAMWLEALGLAAQEAAGTLEDLTNGATLYYAPASIKSTQTITLPNGQTIPFPEGWNKNVVTYTVTIQGQVFFRE